MRANPTILVVDDQPQNIELLEAHLTPQGYEIKTATNGEDALKIIAGHAIDLILLDVMMPGMDGFEVTREIRKMDGFRQLPIILVTALKESEDRVRGIDAGCDDFLTKPIDKMELLARVRSLLKVKDYNDLISRYQKELEIDVAKRTDELKQALDKLKSASLDTIFRLSIAAEYRDEDTGAHVKRMSRYSAAIACRIGLDPITVETILYASPMHDVGKIGIPDLILLKPAKLNPLEWEIMKQHTVIGANILSGSDAPFIKLGESIALCHHEKWDGSGYPNCLKGPAIPIAARIVAVADVFDALASKRPYKEPFPLAEALSLMKENRGTHFDPEVLDAFLDIQDEILAITTQFTDESQNVTDISEMSHVVLKALLQQFNMEKANLLSSP